MMKYTNPNSVSNVNQKRGPTTGQSGESVKRQAFLAERKGTESLANQIMAAIEAGSDMSLNVPKKQPAGKGGSVKPNVNVGRGPTKGNK